MNTNPRITELEREYVDCIDRARAIRQEINSILHTPTTSEPSAPSAVRLRVNEPIECRQTCPISHAPHYNDHGTIRCPDCECAYDARDFVKQRAIL